MLILLIDVIAVLFWLLILHKLNSYSGKNGYKIILKFYFAGLFSVAVVILLYKIFRLSYFEGRADDFSKIVNCIVIVGPVEEFSKFIVFAILCANLKSIRDPRDGIILAASVGLAFASVENYLYGSEYGIRLIIIRSFLCIAGHMSFAAVWGFVYSCLICDKNSKGGHNDFFPVLEALLIAAFIHGLYDVFAEFRHFFLAVSLVLFTVGLTLYGYLYLKKKIQLAAAHRHPQMIRHGLSAR